MKVAQPPLGTPINKSHPLVNGMVGCWLLNEGGGKRAIDSTRLNIIDGNASAAGMLVTKKNGNCATNTGANYIDLGTQPNMNITGAMTISCFGIMTSNPATNKELISARAAAPTTDVSWEFFIVASATQIRFSHGTALGTFQSTGNFATSPLPLDTLNHFVAVRTGSSGAWSAKIYVNGRDLVASNVGTTNNPTATQPTASIGRAGGVNNFYWPGHLNNCMLWNRALSATEVRSLYTNPYQMFK